MSKKNIVGSALILSSLSIANSSVTADDGNSDNKPEKPSIALELMQVHGVRESIYSVKKSGDMRRMVDLIDTPVTITVMTKDQIEESGRSDLTEILSTQAGVTLGTGENGNAFGDRYIIRGHEARSDIFVDGLRDPGMNTRESFSVEQIEITKGPSATFAGRGSSGGAVNSITKKASLDYDFGRIDLGYGTDDYRRSSVDVNTPINKNFATRINLMTSSEDAPKRTGAERVREGILLSGLYDNLTDTRVWLDLYYLNANNNPDLGTTKVNDVIIKDIPVYNQIADFQHSEAAASTLRVEHSINPNWKVYGITRIGNTNNGYVATSAGGTTGYLTEEDAINKINGFDTFTFGTHTAWQDITHFSTQWNLFTNTNWGASEHQLMFSVEYSDYTVINGKYTDTGSITNPNCWASGRGGISNTFCGLDRNGNSAYDLNTAINRSNAVKGDYTADYSYKVTAISVMDTIQINQKLSAFGGLRFDNYKYSNLTNGNKGEVLYAFSDTLTNTHLGIVYELLDDLNLYASHGTATNINGGESDVGANCGYGGLCTDSDGLAAAEPEKVKNFEIGLKMSLNDEALFVQLSAFKLMKTGIMEAAGLGYDVTGSLNTGESEVSGIEIGINGNLTDKLSIQISAANMDSEIIASASNPKSVGLPLALFANDSVYAQARYQFTPNFAFGGDYTYKSGMVGGQPDTGASGPTVPSYHIYNLFAAYNISEAMTLRANLGNIEDTEYYTSTYRAPKFMYIGDRQSLRFSLTYEF